MKTKNVFIFAGIPGSGKSTVRCNLGGSFFNTCSADFWFTDAGGNYNFNPSQLSEAHADCLRKFVYTIQDGVEENVFVDNTNTFCSDIVKYHDLALAFGYNVKVIWVRCDTQTAFERGTHNVPFDAVSRMDAQLRKTMETLPPWIRSKVEEVYT